MGVEYLARPRGHLQKGGLEPVLTAHDSHWSLGTTGLSW